MAKVAMAIADTVRAGPGKLRDEAMQGPRKFRVGLGTDFGQFGSQWVDQLQKVTQIGV
jgi:hypothetical protein